MRRQLPFCSVVVLLLLASSVAAAEPTLGQLVMEAEKLHETDPAAASRRIDELLRRPRRPGDNADRALALAHRCLWTDGSPERLAMSDEGLRELQRGPNANATAESQLHGCRGQAFENDGRLDDAAREYLIARNIAERAGDDESLVDALMSSGYLSYFRGDQNEAIASLQRGYEIARKRGYNARRRAALAYIAHVYADSSVAQYDKAIEYYRQILDETKEGSPQAADTIFNIASTYEQKGDLRTALEWYRRALVAEERLGRVGEQAYVRRSIGVTLSKLGRPADALASLDLSLRTYESLHDEAYIQMVRLSRGVVLRHLGRLNEAIADLQSSRDYYAQQKNVRFLEKAADELAIAYAAAGQWQKAYETRTAHETMQRELAEKLRDERTNRMRVQFDVQKQEQENRALQRENQLRERALEAGARIRRLQTAILILGAMTIAILVYVVVKRIRVARRMREMAMTDELTRLPNRRSIFGVLEEHLERAQHGGAPFSLVAFDIDHFKRINDTWGHAAGDVVLRRIAHSCRVALRPGDSIGRTGGEEFAVLLPATHLQDAHAVAERLRVAVERTTFTDVDPSIRVTISLGVTEWRPSDTTLVKIAGRADEVLYRAKSAGRNRVEMAA